MVEYARWNRAVFALIACAILTSLIIITGCGFRTASTTAAPPTAFAGPPGTVSASPSTTAPVPLAGTSDQCAASHTKKRVVVSLRAQRMWLCDFDRYSYMTPITSGRIGVDTKTPTGKYTIQDPSRDTTLRPGTGESYFVKYWIPFDAPDYGFHDSSWQKIPYGSQRYKTDGSHGCIHVPLKAIEFLFDWASVGTPVDIHA